MKYYFVSYHIASKTSWGMGSCYYRLNGKYFNRSEFTETMKLQDPENKIAVINYFEISKKEFETNQK